MPGLESQIFAVALALFLLIGSAKLTIEQLIPLVILFKKLKATIESEYSLKTGKMEPRSQAQRDRSKDVATPQAASHIPSGQELVNPPSLESTSVEN